jgi:hypothetical protein
MEFIRKGIHTIIGVMVGLCCQSIYAFALQKSEQTWYLGKTAVIIREYQSQKNGLIYYHPHGDEPTSLEVTQKIVAQYGGKIVDIYQNHRRRLIPFYLKQQQYTFDPNRMFSAYGIKQSLKQYGPYSKEAQQVIERFSQAILKALSASNLMVAVHNNLREGFSIRYYMSGGPYAHDVKRLYRNTSMSSHSLVVVTNQHLFDFFKDHHINVILQDNEKVRDDGSLSYYCGKNHIPYVNIETERGNAKDQYAILQTLNSFLND